MKKRIMAAALAATTAFSLAACGGGNETGTKSDLPKGEAKYPIQTEAKLTYWCNLPNQVSSVVSNYGDTPFAKNLAEATGIQVEYMHPAQGQDNALNLLIASGDMPDIVQAYWTQQNPKSCIDNKIILSLNELINDYSPNFKKYTEENPDIAKSLTTDDGDYYVYPFMREDTSLCSTAGFMLQPHIIS